jgi:putative membrane protein
MTQQERNRLMQFAGWGIVGLIILIGISIAASLIFAPRSSGGGFYPFFFPFHFGWLGGIFLVFIVFLVLRLLFWPRRWNDRRPNLHYRDDAHNILRERYAKGEITKEQFEQILHDLERGEEGNHEPPSK